MLATNAVWMHGDKLQCSHSIASDVQFIVFHRRGVEFLPPRQIAVQLAKRHRTLLVDGAVCWRRVGHLPLRRRIKGEVGGLLTYSPYKLAERFGLSYFTTRWNVARMRHELLRLSGASARRYVIFDSPYQLDLIGRLGETRSAYYVYDDFKVDIIGRPHEHKLAELERRMLEQVDVVFAVSRMLAEECLRYSDHVVYLPNGVNSDLFQPRTGVAANTIAHGKPPVIGFAGVISGRVDFVGLYATAVERPHWRFVLLGSKSKYLTKELASTGRRRDLADRFFALPNVEYLGVRRLAEVADVIDTFDVALIPYCLNRFTLASSPLKAYEYYAMGRATVSTRVPEVVDFDREILFVDEEQSYVEQIERSLELAGDANERNRRIRLASMHTTQVRANTIVAAMVN